MTYDLRIVILLLLAALAPGCGGGDASLRQRTLSSPAFSSIDDLVKLPQDCAAYIDPNGAERPLIAADKQKAFCQDYLREYFAPWHRSGPARSLADMQKKLNAFAASPGWGANGDRISPAWIQDLVHSADLEHYPSVCRRAITVRNANLRALPTPRPRFDDAFWTKDGYPFDMFQESAVWANTPVLITHATDDGAYVLAEAPYASGFVAADDVAYVDDAFVKAWETSGLVALVGDNAPVRDDDSLFRFRGRIGMLLPRAGGGGANVQVLIAVGDADRRAHQTRATLAAADVVSFPAELTPRAFSRLANQLLGQPYDWGGAYGGRDCSASLRDLFAPFGFWLPRNSAHQARCGRWIDFTGLDGAAKERMILAQGVPFGTLLRSPGHIMLYIGCRGGRAMILHTSWGLMTRDAEGVEGRYILGRCVITSLQPGIELPALARPGGDLRDRIEGMAVLMPE